MAYTFKDALQGLIGAFTGVFLFILIRAGDPFSIDPKIGLPLGAIWLYLLWGPFEKHRKDAWHNFTGDTIITIIVCWYMSLWFGLVDKSILFTFDYFGSSAWLCVLIAAPISYLFDRHNLNTPLARYYSRK